MKFTAALFRDGKVVVDKISGEFTTSAVGPNGKLHVPNGTYLDPLPYDLALDGERALVIRIVGFYLSDGNSLAFFEPVRP